MHNQSDMYWTYFLHRSKQVLDVFKENDDWIVPIRFTKCSPEFNAVEECWRQGIDKILGSFIPPSFNDMKQNISKYYRTTRFNLNIVKYLCPYL